jgi:hypothetical protein
MSSNLNKTNRISNNKQQKDDIPETAEPRAIKLTVGAAGGTSSKSSVYYRLKIPNSWASTLGYSKDEKDVIIVLRKDKQEIAIIKRDYYETHYGKVK